jgi:hypothetical protein
VMGLLGRNDVSRGADLNARSWTDSDLHAT